jgi:hypothetical protein
MTFDEEVAARKAFVVAFVAGFVLGWLLCQ